MHCLTCGASNRPEQRFCGACGRPLAAAGPTGGARLGGHSAPPARLAGLLSAARERARGEPEQASVLCADVKGSMVISEELDPERWYTIIDGFYAVMSEGVHRFEGIVHGFMGDGVMAVFGAPLAYEDHARRAARAALHLRRELSAYARGLAADEGIDFSVRMGIHSGEVVVGAIGDDLSVEYDSIDRTATLAQRVQALAEPGTVYVTEQCARLIEGDLELVELGEFEISGSSARLRVLELVDERSPSATLG